MRPEIEERFEIILTAFEASWQRGERPSIDDYRARGDQSLGLLIELAHLDLEYRFKSGEKVRVDSYVERYPILEQDAVGLRGLAEAELRLRKQREPGLNEEDFWRRFPALRGGLNLAPSETPSLTPPSTDISPETEINPPSVDSSTRSRFKTLPEAKDRADAKTDASALPSIPGYEILEVIGRGGMGVVYRARDLSFQREVAVKVLQSTASASAVSRFFEESRITGQLQHPGIPAAHQVETLSDGRPFLAMKLIKGDTLDALLKAGKVNYLPIFEAICQAVGYAHARGVIHRDLKPSNIMVGAFGEVQVMDWGLAKVLGDAKTERTSTNEPIPTEIHSLRDRHFTQGGSVMGTPAYMAPEQAAGQIDKIGQRADVFGLGGILCVMLTGRPPFDAADDESIRLNAMRGNTKAALQALDRCTAEPELVSLCKRCLAFELKERPADASAVAKEIAALRAAADERAEQAELARARAEVQSAEQRKRRKVQLALLGSLVLLMASGGAAAWWQAQQASERKAAEARLAGERDTEQRFKVEQARQGIRANLALATDLRKQYKFKFADAALVQAVELAKSGAPELLAEVEQARSDLAFVVQLDDIRYRNWTWDPSLFDALMNYSFTDSSDEYNEAFAAHGLDLVTLDPSDAAKRIAASGIKAYLVAAVDDWALREVDEKIGKRLLEIARRADPGPWLNRFRDPVVRKNKDELAKLAAEVDVLNTSIAAIIVLAQLMDERRLDPSALLMSARTLHPTDFELALVLGLWHLHGKGDQDQSAIGPLEAARAIRPENKLVWYSLGVALKETGNVKGAILALKETVKLDPENSDAHHELGNALMSDGDLEGAIASYKEAVKFESEFLYPYISLGRALHAKGDLDGAIATYREAIKHSPKFANAHHNLGIALKAQGNLEGAIASYREAIKHRPKLATAHNDLGIALRVKGDLEGAIATFREAIKHDSKLASAHYNLGIALQTKGDLEGSIASYEKAIKQDSKFAMPLNNLAWLRAACPDSIHRDGVEAVKLATRACELTAWKNGDYIDTLAAAHAETGDFDKAIEFQKQALKFPEFEKKHGSNARRQLELFAQKKPIRDPTLMTPKPKEFAPPPREVKKP